VLHRREWLALALAGALRGQGEAVHLIAHRGGVVDQDRPENSRAAIEAAIAQN
jgi:glycerophosphoryl diester phosphodiesterase